jgi:hypothetical protein
METTQQVCRNQPVRQTNVRLTPSATIQAGVPKETQRLKVRVGESEVTQKKVIGGNKDGPRRVYTVKSIIRSLVFAVLFPITLAVRMIKWLVGIKKTVTQHSSVEMSSSKDQQTGSDFSTAATPAISGPASHRRPDVKDKREDLNRGRVPTAAPSLRQDVYSALTPEQSSTCNSPLDLSSLQKAISDAEKVWNSSSKTVDDLISLKTAFMIQLSKITSFRNRNNNISLHGRQAKRQLEVIGEQERINQYFYTQAFVVIESLARRIDRSFTLFTTKKIGLDTFCRFRSSIGIILERCTALPLHLDPSDTIFNLQPAQCLSEQIADVKRRGSDLLLIAKKSTSESLRHEISAEIQRLTAGTDSVSSVKTNQEIGISLIEDTVSTGIFEDEDLAHIYQILRGLIPESTHPREQLS